MQAMIKDQVYSVLIVNGGNFRVFDFVYLPLNMTIQTYSRVTHFMTDGFYYHCLLENPKHKKIILFLGIVFQINILFHTRIR